MTVDEYVAKVVAEAPPLTEDQRTRLAELLRPVRARTQTTARVRAA